MKNINRHKYIVADVVKSGRSGEITSGQDVTVTLYEGIGEVRKHIPYSIVADASTQQTNERRAYKIYTKQNYPKVVKQEYGSLPVRVENWVYWDNRWFLASYEARNIEWNRNSVNFIIVEDTTASNTPSYLPLNPTLMNVDDFVAACASTHRIIEKVVDPAWSDLPIE